MKLLKSLIKAALPIIDIFIAPFIFINLYVLRFIRRVGVWNMKYCKNAFLRIGIYPIRDHYYEPLFNPKHLRRSLEEDRHIPGLDINAFEQLKILNNFCYNNELINIPLEKNIGLDFYYHNGAFDAGDAEYLYNIMRSFKPSRLVEVGSGYSTLMAIRAVAKNKAENGFYSCEITCIEPYEMKWLEKVNVKLVRDKVENVDKNIFRNLEKNDILFIDSSHIIRPQGDVLFELFEILPILKSGVLVHFHDIFTPKDYPDEWIRDFVRFWNEQYLLEAFLTNNKEFRIIGALNFLKHNYFNELSDKCPILKIEKNREPGSFWIMKN